VLADEEQLANVFSHLIQNAIEACPADGTVTIGLEARQQDSVTVIIQDSGSGMTADFVRDRLFKPFDSTKGLTGMGIGAYESREYIRALGGEIQVLSEVDLGSTFRISLPAAMGQDKNQGIIE
jgi:signal transduction histidine kinase